MHEKRISVKVEPDLHTRAKVVAARLGCDMSSMVRTAVVEMIERREAEVANRAAEHAKDGC